MTAVNGAPAPEADLGGLAALTGLETVTGQIVDLIAVLRAEQARRQAGIEIRRPAWKDLVFTGGPGTGKSRAARALARLYKDLGLLTYGQLIEIAAADLAGATPGTPRPGSPRSSSQHGQPSGISRDRDPCSRRPAGRSSAPRSA